jgi:hypothetical protein
MYHGLYLFCSNDTPRAASIQSGYYAIVYMDCWDGFKMRRFDKVSNFIHKPTLKLFSFLQ